MTPQQQQQYQQPIQDMGATLGFGGQSTEFQYFDVPQPSQPMAQLRQERLQQLREERMRRQQRRMRGGDVTALFPWRKGRQDNQVPPTPPPIRSGSLPGVQLHPGQISLPGQPINPDIAPVRTSTERPDGYSEASPAVAQHMQPAAASAQDTGMLQKVRLDRATRICNYCFCRQSRVGSFALFNVLLCLWRYDGFGCVSPGVHYT